MEEDLYDEFGNYIGPEIDVEGSEDEQESVRSKQNDNGILVQVEEDKDQEDKWMSDLKDLKKTTTEEQQEDEESVKMEEDEEYYKKGYQIVLHEDKQYYPEAEQIYGKGVETLVMDEDAQPLTQPIIEPPKDKTFQFYEKEIPETTYDLDYLSGLSIKPQLIRNVAICGHLHHGKTMFCDMLIKGTHKKDWDLDKEHKWTDNRRDEHDRNLSIKSSPLTLVLPDMRGKSYLFNFIDTPGHPNFSDEVTAALRLSDGMLLVVDCIEGVTFYVERLIREALKAQLEIIVVINKLDRLSLELRLPLNDAYHKIKHTLDEINLIINTFHTQLNKTSTLGKYTYTQQQISPVNGNVIFSSTMYGGCFTLESFAQIYFQMYQPQESTSFSKHSQEFRKQQVDYQKFVKFLWGDVFYNEETRKFQRKSEGGLPRSFVHFILEPFYKIVSHTISKEKNELMPVLKKLNIYLKSKEYALDIKPLLKLVISKLFGDLRCLSSAMVNIFKNAVQGTKVKVENYYRNSNDDQEMAERLSKCDSKEPLCVNIVKLYNNEQTGGFYSFGRIISGTLKVNDNVKILGEGFTLEEEEDMVVKTVNKLWIMQSGGRYKIEVNMMTAGNWVLIDGIDQTINKTATLTHANFNGVMDIFKPLDFNTESTIKVACEPLNPSELPKMLEGLRKINKSYPLAKTKVEESGEHIIMGSGELYMDQIFHDLRKLYAEIEIKVSEPFVQFAETVVDASSIKCIAETPNKKNTISMIAEPLDRGLAQYIDAGMYDLLPNLLVSEFQWDELTANSIWAFGPQKRGTNMLIDYTLATETDKTKLYAVKDSLIQGFQWATREGPLGEEPIKNVKFKILQGSFANEPIYRSGSQIIPTVRRVAYSSFLLATPRIMEPMFIGEVYCPEDTKESIYNVLFRRRGHVTSEEPKPGSPFTTLKIELPAIESFGFETDLRTHTVGQAMVLTQFSHWQVAPGDPLDKSIVFRPLEPAKVPELAREFMIKTRRRKGLLEDVSIAKFFDNAQMIEMARQDPSLHTYF